MEPTFSSNFLCPLTTENLNQIETSCDDTWPVCSQLITVLRKNKVENLCFQELFYIQGPQLLQKSFDKDKTHSQKKFVLRYDYITIIHPID